MAAPAAASAAIPSVRRAQGGRLMTKTAESMRIGSVTISPDVVTVGAAIMSRSRP
ncbi:MAG: hypothetical protein BWX50_00778 [Euryarchaeota archaeon ADurb.Bin009]|nr:MAG: hypothetical protein BWX50_00778 [Euryarchaeota archaeon ADurb.Bin009]